jgi:serine/threonine protein kinase
MEGAARWIFYQVAKGMDFLHTEMGIVHRDLKHQNILMGRKNADPLNEDERQPTIKICDFTTAFMIPNNDPGYMILAQEGTIPFNAPESFTKPEFLPKPLDVWSFGITLWVYLTNNLPYGDEENIDKAIKDIDFKKEIAKLRVSKDLMDLLEGVLKKDPAKRMTFYQVTEHEWFMGYKPEELSTKNDF